MSAYRYGPLSTGHDYRDPPRPLDRLYSAVYFVFRRCIPYILATVYGNNAKFTSTKETRSRLRSIPSLPTALILIWMFLLWWGEVGTFRSSVSSCDWQYWEKWPDHASPHHIILIADPQLVDPHTYPGRPWPLSTITRHHTDYYMRKSFTLVQNSLDPQTVLFLGDLFDGGREWLPPGVSGSDPRWKNYGEDYWVKEYKRFGNIFFNQWLRRAREGRHLNHQKLLAELPGNHDLGLGGGIKIPVRRRFNAFFGDGNRVDIIGNHTFLMLDTVSLSAKGQFDPATGRQGAIDGKGSDHAIWGPAEEFLDSVKAEKSRVIDRAVRMQNDEVENDLLFHEVLDIGDPLVKKSVHTASSFDGHIPSILLTHVPLYRARDTACGPLRERSPPSKQPSENGEYLEKDAQNAIRVEFGFQYQNVLTPEISREIIDKIGDIEFAFSGDDHDYCEVVHRDYKSSRGGIREITVKAFSWAMGVRRPGFLLLSLWNPLNESDQMKAQKSGDPKINTASQHHQTIQTNLCLLPNQLSIFIRYASFLGITLFALFIRAIKMTNEKNHNRSGIYSNGRILPLTAESKSETSPPPTVSIQHQAQSNGLAVRSKAGRTRAASPYSFPSTIADGPRRNYSGIDLHDDPLDERWGRGRSYMEDDDHPKRKNTVEPRRVRIGREFRKSFFLVGVPVGAWWIFLVSRF